VNDPQGLATAPDGSLYFSDSGNNRVRVVHTDGTIATIAGTGKAGFAGDGGPARAADLNTPAGLAVAADGALLVADSGNDRVRRVGLDGTITTVAGNGGGGSGGDGGKATAAQLNVPVDVAAVAGGGFVIAEGGGNRVRRVDAAGTIARLAGAGGPRFGGDGRAATAALLNAPRAVELMPSGSEVLVADTDNNRIRYVAIPGQAGRLAFAALEQSVLAPLKRVVDKHTKRRILLVSDVRVSYRVTRECDIVARLATKRGRQIARIDVHAAPGAGAIRLPKALRSGKRRLKKDHYVVSMSATTGSQSAAASIELVVK
jgi:sugar lactone lactonase YvrE